MRRRPLSPLPIALAAAALAGAALTGGCAERHAETAPPPPPVRARVVAVEKASVPETLVLRGTVAAARSAVVSTRVMGTVTAVRVAPGDRVAAGDVLVEIDPQASQGQLSQARGALAQAESARALAEKNFRRFEALAARDAASELEVDQARSQLEQAQAGVEQARGAVSSASSIAGDARVRAPFPGRVAQRMVDPGDLAAPGRPLVTIESDGARRLVVPVPASIQAQLSLAPGRTVEVTLDDRADLGRLEGTVVEVAPGAAAGSQAFDIEIDLPVPALATGTSGRAWLATAERPAVVVPRDAILHQGGLELVVLRTEEGTTTTRLVRTGGAVGPDRVEVLSGLAGGESVLVGLGAVPPAGSPVEETAS
ncbi:MAG TPA: efflux RND transporter periplasmic adaptor subunit [Thermoanaerobaculia bacterium]